ncbi:MAG: molecular chaperone DnaJ [Mariprofundales bacterium]
MSDKRDYYEVLGIGRDSDVKDIKRAYRKLAMKYHPDRNKDDQNAAAQFREVTEAYEVLSDDAKRKRYDQYGHAGVDEQMRDFWSHGGFQQSQAFNDFGDVFGNMFSDIFGGGGGGHGRGADLQYELEMSLEEASSGKQVNISVPAQIQCNNCHGSGAKPGTHPIPCKTCGGHGQVQVQQGFFAMRRACPHCNGVGKSIETPCNICRGQGRIRKNKEVNIRVPAGVYHDAQVRVSGEGEAGESGQSSAGDLYLHIRIREHAIFTREGADLHCQMPITFPQAVLGAEVEAPTLDGKVKIRIPAGSEGGQVFRVRGRGVTDIRARGQKGDLYVHAHIAIPKKLTAKQQGLLTAFAEETGDEVYPTRSSFLGKVKNFWDELAGEETK